MDESALDQIAAFQTRFAQAQSTDVVDLPWGFALLQDDFPASHDHNRVVVTSAVASSEALAAADKILGEAGRTHRYISIVDDQLGRDLGDDFVAVGYESETITTMIDRATEATAPTHEVQAISFEDLRPALVRDWHVLLPHLSDAVYAQLADRTALYRNGADVTRLAVMYGDVIAARADLYLDRNSGIAQFENLFTHPDHRGNGYATSLVLDARRRQRQAGCHLSFLGADLDDWPSQWYARLGYVEARRSHNFTLVS